MDDLLRRGASAWGVRHHGADATGGPLRRDAGAAHDRHHDHDAAGEQSHRPHRDADQRGARHRGRGAGATDDRRRRGCGTDAHRLRRDAGGDHAGDHHDHRAALPPHHDSDAVNGAVHLHLPRAAHGCGTDALRDRHPNRRADDALRDLHDRDADALGGRHDHRDHHRDHANRGAVVLRARVRHLRLQHRHPRPDPAAPYGSA